jgi:hypothetical protein
MTSFNDLDRILVLVLFNIAVSIAALVLAFRR